MNPEEANIKSENPKLSNEQATEKMTTKKIKMKPPRSAKQFTIDAKKSVLYSHPASSAINFSSSPTLELKQQIQMAKETPIMNGDYHYNNEDELVDVVDSEENFKAPLTPRVIIKTPTTTTSAPSPLSPSPLEVTTVKATTPSLAPPPPSSSDLPSPPPPTPTTTPQQGRSSPVEEGLSDSIEPVQPMDTGSPVNITVAVESVKLENLDGDVFDENYRKEPLHEQQQQHLGAKDNDDAINDDDDVVVNATNRNIFNGDINGTIIHNLNAKNINNTIHVNRCTNTSHINTINNVNRFNIQNNKNYECISVHDGTNPFWHPLQNAWTLWYLENDRTKTWTDMQSEVATFDNVENFWSLYHHIKPPSEIRIGSDYSLFKAGIMPMWEDPANCNGGRWVITIHKNAKPELDRIWTDVLLSLIGETFEHSDFVCGAVANIRAKNNKICIWTCNGYNHTATMEIGFKLKTNLHLHYMTMYYQLHKDTMMKNGTNVKALYTL